MGIFFLAQMDSLFIGVVGIEDIVDEPRQSICFCIGNAEKFLLVCFAELIPHFVEGFDVALDVEQWRAQLMGHVADEAALGCVELHFSGEVLHGHRDPFQVFSTGFAYGLEDETEGARWFPDAAS